MDKTLIDAIALANHHGLTDREIAAAVEVATAARLDVADAAGVPMVHPNLRGRPIRVDTEAVSMHELAGWVVLADEPPDDDPAKDAAPQPAKAAKTTPKKES